MNPFKSENTMEEFTVEVNGTNLTRDNVKEWLHGKKTILWMDWIITEPEQMDKAVDWFMGAVKDCAAVSR